jgi:hypothetical protein
MSLIFKHFAIRSILGTGNPNLFQLAAGCQLPAPYDYMIRIGSRIRAGLSPWRHTTIKALVLSATLVATTSAQVTLEDFSSRRLNPLGSNLFQLYTGEDAAQVDYGVSNGVWHIKGDTTSDCTSGCYTGGGIYWQMFSYPYLWPSGFMESYVKSGTFSPSINRLNLKFSCSASVPRNVDGSDTLQIGTYVKPHSDLNQSNQGQHYYHQFDFNVYNGHWILVEFNMQPQHIVGGPTTNPIYDPEYNSPTMGGAVHYFDGLTRWYFDTQGAGPNGAAWAQKDCYFKDVELRQVDSEPDTLVSSTTGQHNGTQFELTWAGPGTGQAYNVYYSRTSMHVTGLQSGTSGGSVSDPGGYKAVYWQSPALPLGTGLYVAVQPQGANNFSEIFIPPMDSPSSSFSPCDLNQDGVVNSLDVNLALNAALGTGACIDDLDGDGRCDIVDLQRVVNASNGQVCRMGT